MDLLGRLLVVERRYLSSVSDQSFQGSPASSPISLEENALKLPTSFGLHNVAVPSSTTDQVKEGGIDENKEDLPIASQEKGQGEEELSPWRVMITLLSSSRGMTANSFTVVYGVVIGALEPTSIENFL